MGLSHREGNNHWEESLAMAMAMAILLQREGAILYRGGYSYRDTMRYTLEVTH
jgi:hypothetical protein